MKRKIIPVLIGCTLSFSALAAQPTAERYVVSFPEGTHVNYAGAFASALRMVSECTATQVAGVVSIRCVLCSTGARQPSVAIKSDKGFCVHSHIP